MNRIKSFTIYREYYDLISLLDEDEQKELLLSICKYMFDNKEPNLSEKQMKVFCNLKRPLDKSKNKSNSTSKQNQKQNKNISNKNQNKIKLKTHQDVNVNVYVNNNLYEFIESNFNRTLNSIEYEIISLWEDNDLTRYAIKQAVLNQAYSIKYINTILENYKLKGINTVVDAQKVDKEFQEKKQKNKNQLSFQEREELKRQKEKEEALRGVK